MEFTPTTERRGCAGILTAVFETVTIVYTGEVEDRDLSGGGGRIGPGWHALNIQQQLHVRALPPAKWMHEGRVSGGLSPVALSQNPTFLSGASY
jgi:hypothetical protein